MNRTDAGPADGRMWAPISRRIASPRAASHHEHRRSHMPPMRSSRPGRVPGGVPGRRGRARAMAIAAATAMALLAVAAPAWAHIAVTPETAQAGSAAELTFRVPNEEAKANVTQVQMQIPTDHPIAQLLVKPVP